MDHVNLNKDHIRDRVRSYRPHRLPVPFFRPAAVLLPVFEGEDGTTRLWMLRRPQDGTPHGGQVALPGGTMNANDDDLAHTALREASEELGIEPDDVELFGALDDCVTITRFRVTPHVGWIRTRFAPKPNRAEVARAFHAPLARFLQPADKHMVRWWKLSLALPGYAIDGEVVWGTTGTILKRFGALLSAQ